MHRKNKDLIIDRFNQSINEVVSMFLMRDVVVGESKDMAEILLVGDTVKVNISIIGDLMGDITINLDIDTAKKIISIMTMEENIEEINDVHESALKEILNMITGTFVSKLSEIENPVTKKCYYLDISTPNSSLNNESTIIKYDESNIIQSISYDIGGIGELKSYLFIYDI